MNFNEKHHWLLPLVPTSCAYAKLAGYIGKLLNAKITALQLQGDFGGHLDMKKVTNTQNQRLEIKMGEFKAIVSGMKDTIRNTLAEMGNALSGCEGPTVTLGIVRC